jgi:hypothetical protein
MLLSVGNKYYELVWHPLTCRSYKVPSESANVFHTKGKYATSEWHHRLWLCHCTQSKRKAGGQSADDVATATNTRSSFVLGCSIAWLLYEQTFRRNVSPPSSGRKESANYVSVRLEVLTAVTMKNCVFWDVTKCGSCKNRRFEGTQRLHHQGDKNRWTRN